MLLVVVVVCGCGLWLWFVVVVVVVVWGCGLGLWFGLWVWVVGLGCGFGLWVWVVGLGCGFGLWVWVVGLGCGFGLWVWVVGLGCGFGLWVWVVGLVGDKLDETVTVSGSTSVINLPVTGAEVVEHVAGAVSYPADLDPVEVDVEYAFFSRLSGLTSLNFDTGQHTKRLTTKERGHRASCYTVGTNATGKARIRDGSYVEGVDDNDMPQRGDCHSHPTKRRASLEPEIGMATDITSTPLIVA